MAQNASVEPRVAAIVLAAGGSSRMGELKQLLPLGGRAMVRWTTETLCGAGLAQVIVVVGAQGEAVAHVLTDLPVELVRNERWPEGLSTSVNAGLEAVQPSVQAALMVLADQPALRPETVRSMVSTYRDSGARIVVPVFEGRRGNPVLFDRSLFAEMMAVEGDRGGRGLMVRHEAELVSVDVDDPGVVLDIDTRQEYLQAQAIGFRSCQ